MNNYNDPDPDTRAYDQTEISLLDLWLMLARNKWVFAAVFVTVFLLGAVFAFFKPVTYNYSTLIEIGSRLVGDEIEPIETPTSVAAKLEKGYIPQAQHAYDTAVTADKAFYAVAVNAPPESLLVVMESSGQEQMQAGFVAIHQKVVDSILQDHARIIDVLRQGLKTQLIGQQNALQNLIDQQALLEQRFIRLKETQANEVASLKAQAELLKAEKTRLSETEKLIRNQVKEYEQLVTAAEENRPKAVKEADSEARAMTLLMINNQIEQSRNRLTDLRERLIIGIPRERDRLAEKIEDNLRNQQNLANRHIAERDNLQQSIADNQRQQINIKAKIEETQLDMANLLQTHAVSLAAQSIKPTGLGTVAMLALSIILAGFAGLFSVFILEFARAAEQRSRELNQ